MPDTNSGDSKSETIEFDPKTGESDIDDKSDGEAVQEATKTESTSEGVAPATTEEATKSPEGQSPESKSQEPGKQDMSGEELKLHHQALGLIGSVLEMENKAKAKQFFAEHPELADKANHSKKHKEVYRDLIEEEKEVTPAAAQESTKDEKTIDATDLKNSITADVVQSGMVAERTARAETYAAKHGVNADDFDTLHKAAEALYKNSPNIPYEQCLDGASVTLKGTGKETSKSVNPPTGEVTSQKAGDSFDKETEIKRLISEHGVERRVAVKRVEAKIKASNVKREASERGEDDTGWTDMM